MDNIFSVLNRRWQVKEGDEKLSLFLEQRLNVPPTIARLLSSRGFSNPEETQEFLNPTLKSSLPNPSIFKDMEKAILRLEKALLKNETIVLYGDYDVDGATSSALFKKFFDALGASVRLYIPDRIKEGYGPNTHAFESFFKDGIKLILTLDSGTTAFEALSYAHEKLMDVIVIDHHISELKLPLAYALINPNRSDESEHIKQNYGNLAAVGVSFLTLVALNRRLREQNFYETRFIKEPDLRQFLDLVALGTVADVVPLTGLNRTFVAQGLKIMKKRTNIGLKALADIAKITESPEAYHAGFILGPRINAGGRVGESSLGAHLLSTECLKEAQMISEKLHHLNQSRQEMENKMLSDALFKIEAHLKENPLPAALIVADETWHPGIIGIIAGRLKDRYDRPACVIALKDGIGKASGRSLPIVNLGKLIHQAKDLNLLINGGGHAMAAGFTIEESKIKEFESFLTEQIAQTLKETNYKPTLHIDGKLSLAALTLDFLKILEQMAPFGMGNPTPRFMVPCLRITNTSLIQNTHVRCTLRSEEGIKLDAIAFRAFNTPLGDALMDAKNHPFHFVGTFRRDSWNGREKIQMTIEDLAPIS
ncbi:MAG: single-stranded-DNA-specific exonuclease RecJ [Proteobacteria bacterium]|nr:single-stranded-DNA-specific exonuclease RecJ [Pseudomonadota bacterium]